MLIAPTDETLADYDWSLHAYASMSMMAKSASPSLTTHGSHGGQVKKRLVAWAATAGLATALGLIGTATPALAASCFEASCNGKALGGTDCTTNQLIYDDFQVKSGSTIQINLQLLYSPGCHAFWGEMQVADGGGAGAGLWAIPQYGGVESALETAVTTTGAVETHMWSSAGHSVKLCWGQNVGDDPGDNPPDVLGGCTGWR
jgi:hypothetical protein